ncbi:hypothetical protein BKA70DRAFT_1475810 [Coprinopsis sp. MPI-PUGE-AT-0042]|nr:hypothetical protein BKA70DRAFT_1475810 [Coprinopsis sp. MPI-PUGE-AT-0042]
MRCRVHPQMFHTIAIQTRSCITYNAISMQAASHILSTCTSTGVVDLAFWLIWPSETRSTTTEYSLKTSMACLLSNLPLMRIGLAYEQFQIEHEGLHRGSLHVWCTTLTHLEIFYWPLFVPELHEKVDLASILEERPSLEIVLVDTERADAHRVPIDIRIVYSSADDDDPVEQWAGWPSEWEPWVCKWALAEEEVARRKRWRNRKRKREERNDTDSSSQLVEAMQNL